MSFMDDPLSKQPAQSLYRCSIGSINLRDVVHLSSVKSIDDRVTPLFSDVATCGGGSTDRPTAVAVSALLNYRQIELG